MNLPANTPITHTHARPSGNGAAPGSAANNGGSPRPHAGAGTNRHMGIWIDLHAMGYRRAIDSGALESDPVDLKTLSDLALACAKETKCDPFNPAANAGDANREAEYRHWLAERARAELALQHGLAEVRDAEAEVARSKNGPSPNPPPWLLGAGATLIGVTALPTLHDSIFFPLGPTSSWLASAGVAATVGGFIAWTLAGRWTMLGGTISKRIGLTFGVVVGLGLGVVRLVGASNWGDIGFAAGLTLIELGAVIGLERLGVALREQFAQWSTREVPFRQALARLEGAVANVTRRRATLAELQAQIDAHIAYVDDRAARSGTLKELEQAAVKAVIDGYHAGIAENKGRVLGVRGGAK